MAQMTLWPEQQQPRGGSFADVVVCGRIVRRWTPAARVRRYTPPAAPPRTPGPRSAVHRPRPATRPQRRRLTTVHVTLAF